MVDDVAKHCVYNTDLGLVVDFLFVVLWLYIEERFIHRKVTVVVQGIAEMSSCQYKLNIYNTDYFLKINRLQASLLLNCWYLNLTERICAVNRICFAK